MGGECRYNKNNSIGIKLLCGKICCTCLGEITLRPGTEYRTKQSCGVVTGCLKPTNVIYMYLLAGIAPPDIRRDVCARVEKTEQETNEAHSIYGQHPAERWIKSMNCFLHNVKPAEFSIYGVINGFGDYKQHHTKLLST